MNCELHQWLCCWRAVGDEKNFSPPFHDFCARMWSANFRCARNGAQLVRCRSKVDYYLDCPRGRPGTITGLIGVALARCAWHDNQKVALQVSAIPAPDSSARQFVPARKGVANGHLKQPKSFDEPISASAYKPRATLTLSLASFCARSAAQAAAHQQVGPVDDDDELARRTLAGAF